MQDRLLKVTVFLFSILLIASPVYSDICGETSIGKDNDTYRGNIKLGYDFEMGDITLIPYIDYVNYFHVKEFSGYPFRDVFGCGVLTTYKDMWLRIEHKCSHAVSSLNSRDKPVLYNDAEINSSSTYITVGFKWGKEF